MIDICFVGNSSVDHIVTKNGCHKTFGGSAIYSSYSCRHISDVEIAIISNVNKKLKVELNNKDINVIGDNNPLVEFEIDEINGTCSAKKYLTIIFLFLKQLISIIYIFLLEKVLMLIKF